MDIRRRQNNTLVCYTVKVYKPSLNGLRETGLKTALLPERFNGRLLCLSDLASTANHTKSTFNVHKIDFSYPAEKPRYPAKVQVGTRWTVLWVFVIAWVTNQ